MTTQICKAAGIGYETDVKSPVSSANEEPEKLTRIRCGRCYGWFSKKLSTDSTFSIFAKCKNCHTLNDCGHLFDDPSIEIN